MDASSNPFVLCPDSLCNRVKLKGILCDFFPTEKLKINVILAAYDEGIVDTINAASILDNILAGKLIKTLMSDYGISDDSARLAAKFWLEQYGKEVLNKPCNLHLDEIKNELYSNRAVSPSRQTTSIAPTVGAISVKQAQEAGKFPKSIIQRDIPNELRYGIKDLKCAVSISSTMERYSFFDFCGEYFCKVSEYLLIVCMIYNVNNELVEAAFDYKIDSSFCGHKTFKMQLRLPNSEHVAKVVVKILPDPTFA